MEICAGRTVNFVAKCCSPNQLHSIGFFFFFLRTLKMEQGSINRLQRTGKSIRHMRLFTILRNSEEFEVLIQWSQLPKSQQTMQKAALVYAYLKHIMGSWVATVGMQNNNPSVCMSDGNMSLWNHSFGNISSDYERHLPVSYAMRVSPTREKAVRWPSNKR